MLHSSFVCPQLILFVVKMRVLYVLLASTLSLLVRHQFSLAIPRPCILKYTRHQIVSLNRNINSPSSEMCSYLKYLGIHSTCIDWSVLIKKDFENIGPVDISPSIVFEPYKLFAILFVLRMAQYHAL